MLASPRGFCAGVDRAIAIVEKALEKFGSPIYVRHEIVHNKIVVDRLRLKGAVFVEDLSQVPAGQVVIFSAHGVPQVVVDDASQRTLKAIDATCPLVKRVHAMVKFHDAKDTQVILIGHAGHPEVEGTMGQLSAGKVHLVGSVADVNKLSGIDPDNIAYTTQTTLSIDETRDIIEALAARFPSIRGPEKGDLCYATTNRQLAVQSMVPKVQLLLVIGSSNSSNSNRLRELGASGGVQSYLIDGPENIDEKWFSGVDTVGISSGASAPEDLVQGVVEWIQTHFAGSELESFYLLEETVQFKLPAELRDS